MNKNVKALCEAAVMIAIAQILGQIPMGRLPNGGSIAIIALPIILFGVRYGVAWGGMAGFVCGFLDYVIGSGIAIDWTTMICDYLIAFAMIGVGAGLFRGRKWGVFYGTVVGISLQFLSSYLIGVFVWGKWMPDTFWGMPMTSPWIYSFLYNISWAGPNLVLCLVVFAFLYRPMRKYFTCADLQRA